MDLDFAMLADGVIPRPDGKFDIYGAGWDTIFAAAVPARHQRLVLAVRVLLSRAESEHPHRLDVIIQGADGAEIGRGTAQLSVLPPEARQQIPASKQVGIGMVLNFDNLVFPVFGDYQIVVQWDGNEARAPLRLTVSEQQTSAPS